MTERDTSFTDGNGPLPAPGHRPPPGLKVLVVDDDPDAAESLAILLRMHGHDARVALDGPSALRSARSTPPDVVLLDICLPGMNGFEVARAIQEQREEKRPLFLALTGQREEAERQSPDQVPFDLHLLKPVDPGQLERVLRRFQALLNTCS